MLTCWECIRTAVNWLSVLYKSPIYVGRSTLIFALRMSHFVQHSAELSLNYGICCYYDTWYLMDVQSPIYILHRPMSSMCCQWHSQTCQCQPVVLAYICRLNQCILVPDLRMTITVIFLFYRHQRRPRTTLWGSYALPNYASTFALENLVIGLPVPPKCWNNWPDSSL